MRVGEPSIELITAKALAATKQPRHVLDTRNPRALPHADPRRQDQSFLLKKLPLTCRLLIWKHVLQVRQTRLERWRPAYDGPEVWSGEVDILDVDCFPYRIITGGQEKPEKPLALLLCCRQL
jgi:hypothetical protein